MRPVVSLVVVISRPVCYSFQFGTGQKKKGRKETQKRNTKCFPVRWRSGDEIGFMCDDKRAIT